MKMFPIFCSILFVIIFHEVLSKSLNLPIGSRPILPNANNKPLDNTNTLQLPPAHQLKPPKPPLTIGQPIGTASAPDAVSPSATAESPAVLGDVGAPLGGPAAVAVHRENVPQAVSPILPAGSVSYNGHQQMASNTAVPIMPAENDRGSVSYKGHHQGAVPSGEKMSDNDGSVKTSPKDQAKQEVSSFLNNLHSPGVVASDYSYLSPNAAGQSIGDSPSEDDIKSPTDLRNPASHLSDSHALPNSQPHNIAGPLSKPNNQSVPGPQDHEKAGSQAKPVSDNHTSSGAKPIVDSPDHENPGSKPDTDHLAEENANSLAKPESNDLNHNTDAKPMPQNPSGSQSNPNPGNSQNHVGTGLQTEANSHTDTNPNPQSNPDRHHPKFSSPPPHSSGPHGLPSWHPSSGARPYGASHGGGNSGTSEGLEYGQSHFFSYFITIIIVAAVLYLVNHNKKKILALVIEGRRPGGSSGRRRPKSKDYRRLSGEGDDQLVSDDQRRQITGSIVY